MSITAFLSYIIVANLSPGPNTIISMSNGSRFDLRKSLKFNLGVSAGAFTVLLLCGIFSLALIRLFPWLQSVMVWVGAGYILWLSWRTYRNETSKEQNASGSKGLFLQGVLLQFVNPNTILYGMTVFSTFIVPHYKSPGVLICFCILLSLVAFAGTSCWTLFGSIFRKIITKYEKRINTVMAMLLAYCAVSLVL